MSYKVIDISQWQGVIDWETVKPNIDGAIIRCGWGSDYIGQDDSFFERNCAECERLGIPYGVYLYSYATSVDAARSEAQHALRLIKGKNLSLPVYFDSEENGTEYDASAKAMAFCEIIRNAGYRPGVYASISWWKSYLQGVSGVSVWCAHWQTSSPGMDCDIWQYTSDGSVPGITGRVDMNECYIDVINRGDYPMEFVLNPDGCGKCFYVNGSDITYIPHIDGLNAIDMIADKVGTHVPLIEIGSKEAPYGYRFFEACGKTDLYSEIVNGNKPQTPSEANNATLIELINAIAQALIAAGEQVVK